MAVPGVLQRRAGHPAFVQAPGAPARKGTAGGIVDGAGDVPLQIGPGLPLLRVQGGDGGHEGLAVGVEEIAEELLRLRLLHHGAEIHHRHPVADMADHGHLMGDEEHGQGEAIARNLAAMSHLNVPVITVVTGEGNSGGALAISVANRVIMLENAVYSVLSPEGFASILWKDSSRAEEACALMKMTSYDLKDAGFCDEIIEEPEGGMQVDSEDVYERLSLSIEKALTAYSRMNAKDIIADRHEKYRNIDEVTEPASFFRKKA